MFLCRLNYLPKCYENFEVDLIFNQWSTVIFVDFIDDQKYMLLL